MSLKSIAILIIIFLLLKTLFAYGISDILLTLYSQGEYAEYRLHSQVVHIISAVIEYSVNIVLAIWIYKKAREEERESTVWVALTLFFGLLAVILFYLDLIYTRSKSSHTS